MPASANPPPGASGKPLSRSDSGFKFVRTFAIAIFIWALDFKSEAAGSAAAFQGVILCAYVILFLRVTVAAEKRNASIGSLWMLILATAVFLIDSSVVGLGQGQPFYAIVVNLVPFFIYVSVSALTCLTLSASEDDLPAFLNVLRVACLTFAALHIVVLLLTHGRLDVANSRFEVLSGAVIPSLGIVAVALLQRLSKLDMSVLIFNLLITLLSVTRTLFVVLAAQVATVFVARPSAIFKSSTVKGLALFTFAALVVVALDFGAGTGLVDRWVSRLTVSGRLGADPTALTRSAETHFMMDSFWTSTETVMFGNGMAAVTSLTGPDAQLAAELVGWASLQDHDIGHGHENYASILFVAGIVGGGGLLAIQLLNGLQSIALIRRIQLRTSDDGGTAAHIGAWGAFIVIGMLAFGFLAGTLWDRPTCIWFGIGTGMLYWARGVVK